MRIINITTKVTEHNLPLIKINIKNVRNQINLTILK